MSNTMTGYESAIQSSMEAAEQVATMESLDLPWFEVSRQLGSIRKAFDILMGLQDGMKR